MVGAMVDLIIDHAASDGVELQLLGQAADLWTQGLALYDQLTMIRQNLDAAVLNPTSPDATQLASAAVAAMNGFKSAALTLSTEAQALHAAIDPLPYLTAHPRQSDIPSKKWGWRDAFIGRRTEAFVEGLFHAANTPRSRSFAFGALASYAGNVTGSAYLGAVVGGPRRLHRYRDRLARNTIGAWLHAQLGTPDCAALARAIGFRPNGFDYGFPADVTKILDTATAAAWPGRTAPDWNLGLARAVKHLDLLDVFQRPDLPTPPPPELIQGGDVTGMLTTLDDNNIPIGTIDTGGDASLQVGNTTVADSKSKGGDICLAILLILITIGIALLIYCIAQWAGGKKCDPEDFFNSLQGSDAPDPRAPTSVTQQQLTAMSDPAAAAHISQELYALQMMLWQGFDASAAFLAVTGLIYPDDLLLASPLYQQFLSTPSRPSWPHREEVASMATYQFDPVSPIEQPPSADAPFPAFASPLGFASLSSPLPLRNPTTIAHGILHQVLEGAREEQNRDMDADRGFEHPCWSIQAGTSIHNPVLAVEVLPYGTE
jgi:hypothetical protein